MRVVSFDPNKCISALHAIKMGMRAAAANFSREEFDFYGIIFQVEEDSDPELLMREWCRALFGCLGDRPIVGPYPPEELTPEELARDTQIIASQPKGYIPLRSNPNFAW